jgi:hypothetical protein
LPLTDHIAFEVLQLFSEDPTESGAGSYDQIELHVFRIGQDLIQGAGLNDERLILGVRLTPGASSNYAVFKGPATLYAQKTMPDGIAFVLISSKERGGVPSAKRHFPVPNSTG